MDKKHTFISIFTILWLGLIFDSFAQAAISIDDRAKLGEVYSLEKLKQFDKAIPIIEELYKHHADDREIEWSYVRVLGFGGHWKEAKKVFDVLCGSKCDEDMFVTYAHILEAQGPDPQTLIVIKELADQHPAQKKIQSIYTEILSWNVQSPLGQQAIEELSVKYPDDLKIARAYADALVSQKRFADAISQINNLLSRNPNDKALRFQHAKVVSAQGDHEGAVKELKDLLNDGTTNKEAAIMLGDELRFLGRNEESIKVYQGVVNEK